MKYTTLLGLLCVLATSNANAQPATGLPLEKARICITDSTKIGLICFPVWETSSAGWVTWCG